MFTICFLLRFYCLKIMFPLISQANNYFSLLEELRKKHQITYKEINPVLKNDVNLCSDIRDVGLIIPIETIDFQSVSVNPGSNDVLVEGESNFLETIASGQYATLETSLHEKHVDDRVKEPFFADRIVFLSSSVTSLPIFHCSGEKSEYEYIMICI